MDPFDEFQAGNLDNAVAAITEVIKKQPMELGPRTFLFELLCFKGDWERALKQLDLIGHQHGESEWGAQVFQNLIVAEQIRSQVFEGTARPETFLDPPAFMEDQLQAIADLAGGDDVAARASLAKAVEQRTPICAIRNGEKLAPFQDCDDLLSPVLELIIMNDYVWVPFEQIKELEVSPPERPRDLIWAAARLILNDDSQRRAYLPALYEGSSRHDDDQIKLGRLTDWSGSSEGPIRGHGQKLLLAGEEGLPMLELGTVTLEPAGS